MKPSVYLFCAAALFSPAVVARADEAEEAGHKLLTGLEAGFDARLAGTSCWGIYMGGKALGTVESTVERAPEESGAVYRERVVMQLSLGPRKMRQETTALFDARLGLIHSEQLERNQTGEEVSESRKVTRREGDTWVREQTGPDGKTVTLTAEGGENHEASLMLVLVVAGNKPGKYALRGVEWPKTGEGEAGTWHRLELEVAEAAEVEHRGAKVQAHAVKGTKGDEPPMQLVVSSEGKVLSMSPGGQPFKMVAGTPEEAKQDLPSGPKAPVAGLTEVPAAIELYFRVLSGEQPIDGLDRILDWKSVHATIARDNPEVAEVTPEQFAELTKAEIKQQIPAIPPEQVNVVLPMLQTSVEGDEAVVQLPGNEATFRLRKQADGTWRIYEFPR